MLLFCVSAAQLQQEAVLFVFSEEETLKKNTRSNTFTEGRVRGCEGMLSLICKIWRDDDIERI